MLSVDCVRRPLKDDFMVKADTIPAEVRERIHRVASELYAKTGYQFACAG
jgi:hypothetical protein